MNIILKLLVIASFCVCAHASCAQTDTTQKATKAPVVPGQREGSGPDNNYNHPPANKERDNNSGTNNENYNKEVNPDSVRNEKSKNNNRNSPGAVPHRER